MLGTMLKYNNSSNIGKRNEIAKNEARARALEDRQRRMEEQERLFREQEQIDNNNSGTLGKILEMSPLSAIFIGTIDKLIDTIESNGITDRKGALGYLSSFDKNANEEEMEQVLELMVEKMKEDEDRRYNFNFEAYELSVRREYEQEMLNESIEANRYSEMREELINQENRNNDIKSEIREIALEDSLKIEFNT